MSSTRTAPEWRDDMPRTFSSVDLPPHFGAVQPRLRRLSALLIPRLVPVPAQRR